MDRFLKRKLPSNEQQSSSKSCESNLSSDPGKRIKISAYHPNDRDKIRRAYLQRGPCQPTQHNFPQRKIGKSLRRFCPSWFNEFGNWLEYSIEKDVAFCLCCYLFRHDYGKQSGGDTFVIEGFTNWNKKERLSSHVGGPNSAHNIAWRKCQDLMNQNQHIEVVISKQSKQVRDLYRRRLTASIDCIRFLLKQGFAFRGHDESTNSANQGNFLELLRFLVEHNESINHVVLENAPENHQLIVPKIQKDIVNAAALETTNAIIIDLGDELFAIIVDEARDISNKEQMAIVLRYVNKKGSIVERFFGMVHVKDTTALSLKMAIDELFCKHGLSISRIRGQGYDGASNMQGEFSGLKSLILKENSYAFYVHCFAYQLQLTLVVVAKNHIQVASLFNFVSTLLNVVGGSCKRHDMLREKQINYVREALGKGEIPSGQGLNQETSLKRAIDTRWEDFDFAFTLHLMKNVLGISNELSQALQRKDQDIINAMNLVNITKLRLQTMRDNGWESLLQEVNSFCDKHFINIPNMEDIFFSKGRSRRGGKAQGITTEHHYRELNDRFTETNTRLLFCMDCLNPTNLFSAFDKARLIEFAKFYPCEFSAINLVMLDNQLETYIIDMRSNVELSFLKGIKNLSEKLVETGRHIVYPLVYLLLKLAMILPVATSTMERAFSAMKIVKNRLRNRLGDAWMNDCLVTYIEKDMFNKIDNERIIQRFQNMKSRRGQL
ncbi:hypothetical protein GLYMA_10G055700v4 [Glycine max]|uniref:TTF-type domain-containing protein n=1 Tax=Glycine max TaxID=3847 RepID=A0A0R0I0V7_SOYBN|nr:hypothetical protein GLYMA_10G055700v4 [Glycine max]